jgi:hypothetical protein
MNDSLQREYVSCCLINYWLLTPASLGYNVYT